MGLFWRILSAASLVGMIAVNIVANALPLNGVTTGEISDRHPTYFAPAGYVFAIWLLIYIALAEFAVAQLSPKRELAGPVRPLFVLGNVVNIGWLFAWHHDQLGVTVLLMLVLLVSLIAVRVKLQRARWFLRLPFSIYLGWICVATIANVAAWLVSIGYHGAPLDGMTWSAIMLCVATVLMLLLLWRWRDPVPALVLVWAAIGIAVKYDVRVIRATAGVAVALLAIACAAREAHGLLARRAAGSVRVQP